MMPHESAPARPRSPARPKTRSVPRATAARARAARGTLRRSYVAPEDFGRERLVLRARLPRTLALCGPLGIGEADHDGGPARSHAVLVREL
jgi:hypothetical protein